MVLKRLYALVWTFLDLSHLCILSWYNVHNVRYVSSIYCCNPSYVQCFQLFPVIYCGISPWHLCKNVSYYWHIVWPSLTSTLSWQCKLCTWISYLFVCLYLNRTDIWMQYYIMNPVTSYICLLGYHPHTGMKSQPY